MRMRAAAEACSDLAHARADACVTLPPPTARHQSIITTAYIHGPRPSPCIPQKHPIHPAAAAMEAQDPRCAELEHPELINFVVSV